MGQQCRQWEQHYLSQGARFKTNTLKLKTFYAAGWIITSECSIQFRLMEYTV